MSPENPEIANAIDTGGFSTNYHDQGEGFPLLLVHGSGPGVSSWANWRGVIPALAQSHRVIAPDMVGFGFTERPADFDYSLDHWVAQLIDLMDKLDIVQADIIGNSFGGAVALATAIKYPQRIRKLVLMGSVGVAFEISHGLDAVWGYTPSVENMRKLMDLFAWDRSLVTDELAELRYQASIRPGVQESFANMFPAPRQRWVEAMASEEQAIRAIDKATLIIHGRDDQVIPLETSLKLAEWIENSELHVFGHCGHWTQIEKNQRFIELVKAFLN